MPMQQKNLSDQEAGDLAADDRERVMEEIYMKQLKWK